MDHQAEFRSSRFTNTFLGVGLLALSACAFFLPFYSSEKDVLNSHVRKGGIIKLIEQAIGWETFSVLMMLFGVWLAIYGIVSLWKALDPRPDVAAGSERMEFHPAVKRNASSYGEVSHWRVEIVSNNPVLWIHLFEPYWSLQGLFKRKTIKLEGGHDQIAPLAEYFARHPVMSEKFSN